MRSFKRFPLVQVRSANLSKAALKRLAWVDYWLFHDKNISLTCRHFGIPRDTFYLWKRRFNKYNLHTLEDNLKTRTPHNLRQMTTSKDVIDLVCKIRGEDVEKSKYEIQAELLDLYDIKIGYNTIQKIINRHIHLLNTQHRKQARAHKKRSITRLKAESILRDKDLGSLVQIDTKHLYILGKRFYVFVAVDCKSRYGFIWAYKTASSENAADFLLKVIDYFPFKITAVNTDNGPEYLLNFHKLTERLNIPHYFNHPHTPKMNGRAERLIQTVEYEFFNYQEDLIDDLEEINLRCEIFNDKYNNLRYNRAIGYKTPTQYVKSYLAEKGEQLYVI